MAPRSAVLCFHLTFRFRNGARSRYCKKLALRVEQAPFKKHNATTAMQDAPFAVNPHRSMTPPMSCASETYRADRPRDPTLVDQGELADDPVG